MQDDTSKLENIERRLRAQSVDAAYHAAANFCAIAGHDGQSLDWPALGGRTTRDDRLAMAASLAGFVRHHGGDIVPESLFRFAGGQAMHDTAIEGDWSCVDFKWRAPFTAFCATLLAYDKMVEAELRDVRQKLAGAAPARDSLAGVALDDTIFAPQPGLLDMNPNMRAVVLQTPEERAAAEAAAAHEAQEKADREDREAKEQAAEIERQARDKAEADKAAAEQAKRDAELRDALGKKDAAEREAASDAQAQGGEGAEDAAVAGDAAEAEKAAPGGGEEAPQVTQA